ncbi:MAG: hypothetical protein ACYDEO_26215 [Aggregatilineales bacterium]
MNPHIYRDVFGDEITLTDSVREMILVKHPEAANFIDQIGHIVAAPDEVRRSIRDERSILYYRFESAVLSGKWVVVVIKRIDRNFVSTVYATDQIKSGEIIWTKSE